MTISRLIIIHSLYLLTLSQIPQCIDQTDCQYQPQTRALFCCGYQVDSLNIESLPEAAEVATITIHQTSINRLPSPPSPQELPSLVRFTATDNKNLHCPDVWDWQCAFPDVQFQTEENCPQPEVDHLCHTTASETREQTTISEHSKSETTFTAAAHSTDRLTSDASESQTNSTATLSITESVVSTDSEVNTDTSHGTNSHLIIAVSLAAVASLFLLIASICVHKRIIKCRAAKVIDIRVPSSLFDDESLNAEEIEVYSRQSTV